MGLRKRGIERNPDNVRKCRLELRRIGVAHGIQLPAIDGPPETYRKEHGALMTDIGEIVGALKRKEAESPEKYAEIRAAASEVLKQYESLRKV